MKILILGAYYSSNLGDGVICETVAWLLQKRYPTAQIEIEDVMDRHAFIYTPAVWLVSDMEKSSRRDRLRRTATKWFHYDKVYDHELYRKNEILKHIDEICRKDADLVVFAGGQLYMDRFALILQSYIDAFTGRGIPVLFNACGTGLAYSRKIFKGFEHSLKHPLVRMITCRDGADQLKQLCPAVKDRIQETFDPALWAADCYRPEGCIDSNKPVGLGVMYTANASAAQVTEFWRKVICTLETEDIPWKFFVNGSPDDVKFAEHVFASIPELKGRNITDYLSPVPKSPKELVEVISSFRSLISFRLHSHIIASSLTIPSLAIVWDDKVRAFFRKIGYPERCFAVSAKAEDILEELKKAEREGIDQNVISIQKNAAASLLYQYIDEVIAS